MMERERMNNGYGEEEVEPTKAEQQRGRRRATSSVLAARVPGY